MDLFLYGHDSLYPIHYVRGRAQASSGFWRRVYGVLQEGAKMALKNNE